MWLYRAPSQNIWKNKKSSMYYSISQKATKVLQAAGQADQVWMV
jgi:hypothetical protein